MRIDVHAHYYPKKYIELAGRLGSDLSPVLRAPYATEEKQDVDARLQMMDESGVAMQILSVSATQPYFERESDSVNAARQANDLYAEFVSSHAGRFAAFAAVPLPHVDAALRETERALDQLGMVGVTLGTSVRTGSAVAEAFDPLFAELNRRGCPMFIHPAGLGLCSHLLNDYNLTWPIGAPLEDTMFVLHAIQRQLPLRFPKIKIIVPHLGGALVSVFNRIDFGQAAFAKDNPEPPTATARRMFYDTVVQDNAVALRAAVEVLGAERLLYGSDYPYQVGDRYRRSVSYLQGAGLAPEALDRILERNAADLLGISATK